MTATSSEQTLCGSAEGHEVDPFLLVEDLAVNKIVCALVASGLRIDRRTCVELLCELVVDRQHRDRPGSFETERIEELDDVVGEA